MPVSTPASPSVRAEKHPAVTTADSAWVMAAIFSPTFVWTSSSIINSLAAPWIVATTSSCMRDPVIIV
ncbi:hypothetical protein D3C87_1905830 [compost metagenome]